MTFTLYDYYRSTACYRVRIALNLKGIPYEKREVHLVNNGGEQHGEAFRAINPQGLVPALTDNGTTLTQSLAIIDYLDERFKVPPLLPENTLARAQVRALALSIACDIHPLNNLRATKRLRAQFGADDTSIQAWYHHWLKEGFDALEQQLSSIPRTGHVCHGDRITLADICLVPQVYNATRFNFSLKNYPLIQAINAHCLKQPAFQAAQPEPPTGGDKIPASSDVNPQGQ